MSVTIHVGDCREVMRSLPDASVDSIATDPPYELGFMGKSWDKSGIANDPAMWAQCLRVLKPGGHLLAFSGTRTYHRMVCAIEDAGFEIRDQIGWAYGSGFPKSLDVSKAIDKAAGAERGVIAQATNRQGDGTVYGIGHSGAITSNEPITAAAAAWQGWGTALKPAWEPICVARKPLVGTVAANVLAHGTGALNIDGCRVAADGGYATNRVTQGGDHFSIGSKAKTRGTTFEPSEAGRWPANLIHDGSDEVLAAFPDAPGQLATASSSSRKNQNVYGTMARGSGGAEPRADSGSAARFFYCAKADKDDRGEGNTHPTVKPAALMQYLCRLVTPPGGTVLDPFAGSGSTLLAADREGFNAIGIELNPEYADIARRRIHGDAPLLAEVA